MVRCAIRMMCRFGYGVCVRIAPRHPTKLPRFAWVMVQSPRFPRRMVRCAIRMVCRFGYGVCVRIAPRHPTNAATFSTGNGAIATVPTANGALRDSDDVPFWVWVCVRIAPRHPTNAATFSTGNGAIATVPTANGALRDSNDGPFWEWGLWTNRSTTPYERRHVLHGEWCNRHGSHGEWCKRAIRMMGRFGNGVCGRIAPRHPTNAATFSTGNGAIATVPTGNGALRDSDDVSFWVWGLCTNRSTTPYEIGHVFHG